MNAVDGCLRDAGGVARAGELVRRGATRRSIAAECERGLVVRVGHGWYALPEASPGLVAAARVRGAITCVSALELCGLPLLERPVRHHVAIATGRGAPRRGVLGAEVQLHWSAAGPSRGPVAPVALALADAARCLPLPQLVAAMDAALARRLVTDVELAAAQPRSGAPVFRRARELADARSGSLQESLVRVALVEAGFGVEPQVSIPGVGRVDLLVERRVVLETDGFAYHSDRSAFREDRRRDRRLALAGYPVLRYAFEDAVFGLGDLLAEVGELVHLTRAIGSARADRAGERR